MAWIRVLFLWVLKTGGLYFSFQGRPSGSKCSTAEGVRPKRWDSSKLEYRGIGGEAEWGLDSEPMGESWGQIAFLRSPSCPILEINRIHKLNIYRDCTSTLFTPVTCTYYCTHILMSIKKGNSHNLVGRALGHGAWDSYTLISFPNRTCYCCSYFRLKVTSSGALP